jgi:S1-C subfamily serine protease
MPPDARPPERCDGVGGTAQLSCSDGSALELEWLSDPSCSSGYGRGVDKQGRLVHFVFGGSEERAAAAMREALAERRDKPNVPGPDVTGKKDGSSSGTAFFVGSDGLLLTNFHVIEDKSKIQVLLDDGDLVDAVVVNSDPENDIALLKVPAIREPLALLRENALQRGDEVLVLGYPLVPLQGIEQKATFGRVNALSGLQGDERYAQMDAAIQPGNSGGPMLNRRGEVVGVVSAMLNQIATMQIAGVVPQNVNYALKADFAHTHLRRTVEGWASEGRSVDAKDWIELIQTLENSVVLVLAE